MLSLRLGRPRRSPSPDILAVAEEGQEEPNDYAEWAGMEYTLAVSSRDVGYNVERLGGGESLKVSTLSMCFLFQLYYYFFCLLYVFAAPCSISCEDETSSG